MPSILLTLLELVMRGLGFALIFLKCSLQRPRSVLLFHQIGLVLSGVLKSPIFGVCLPVPRCIW